MAASIGSGLCSCPFSCTWLAQVAQESTLSKELCHRNPLLALTAIAFFDTGRWIEAVFLTLPARHGTIVPEGAL
jgi:hypothetical protein